MVCRMCSSSTSSLGRRPLPTSLQASTPLSEGMTVKPYRSSVARLSCVMGFSSMPVFMAGATSFGHLAASTTVVSISSAMPCAILAITLAVAGATKITSAFFASEMWVTSNLKSRSKVSTMHLWPVRVSKVRGVMNWVAFLVMMTSTSAPSLRSALATLAIL